MFNSSTLQRVLLVILAVLLILGTVLLVYFKLDQIGDTADQLMAEKAGLKQDRDRLTRLELLMLDEEELREQYKRAELLIPDDPEEERLALYLQDYSVYAGMDFAQIQFYQRVQRSHYVDMPFEIAFSGGYESLIELLKSVNEGERAVRIDTISARDTGGGTNEIRVDIRAHSFSKKMR